MYQCRYRHKSLTFSKPQPFTYTNTMHLSVTVTATVVTLLFTLIRAFLFQWYHLSPPPPGHSTRWLWAWLSVCLLFCIIMSFRNAYFYGESSNPQDMCGVRSPSFSCSVPLIALPRMGPEVRCWWMNYIVSITGASTHSESHPFSFM